MFFQKLKNHVLFLKIKKYSRFAFSVLVSALFVLAGVIFIVAGCGNFPAAVNFGNRAVAITGTVTGTSYHTTYPTESGLPVRTAITTIKFKTKQGKIFEHSAQDFCTMGCRGRKVEILYDPDAPHIAMVKGGYSPLCQVVQFIVMGIVFTGAGVDFFKNYARRK